MIPLTKVQKEIMNDFYEIKKTKVVFNKKQRKILWGLSVQRREIPDHFNLEKMCPALKHQITRSIESGNNIQSAVFSECVYAQTLANMLNLNVFSNCYTSKNVLDDKILSLLKSYSLYPRYVYSNKEKTKILIQAGGCGGIDSALITVIDYNVYTIEFKEPYAKTSEPDLPKYKEDGILVQTRDFETKYPQFSEMLKEKKSLNFFEIMGHNENNFSVESLHTAISNNYTKKFADVVCTEDKNSYLTMMPSNQLSMWGSIEGEIRPAGRNHYKVWTPIVLKEFIKQAGGKIDNSFVEINKDLLIERKQRGGNNKVSGYKINPLFFVKKEACSVVNGYLKFNIKNVRQLNPTIAAKVNFRNLKYTKIQDYYLNN